MIKDIDYYFDPNTWIIPSNVLGFKNSGLKIKIDSLSPDSIMYFSYYGDNLFRDTFGIIKDGNLINANFNTSNLFKVIQYSGFSDYGILNGTFSLIKEKGKTYEVYKLIPEDSREYICKSAISKIYYDKNVKFTTKMIPGHLYISKRGSLFICLKSDMQCYSADSYYNPGITEKPTPLLLQ